MLSIESIFNNSFFGSLHSLFAMPATSRHEDGAARREQRCSRKPEQSSASAQPRRRRIPRITQPEPGSLYDIMHEHCGTSLYSLPICWTDLHAKLLGVRFEQLPTISEPVPDNVPGRWLEPSQMARNLTTDLHTLIKPDTTPGRAFCKNRAMKHVMSTLFPTTLSHPKTAAELDLFFGPRFFKKAIRVRCLWKSPGGCETSFDSAPTLPSTSFSRNGTSDRDCPNSQSLAPNQPMLAYISKSHLAMIRSNLFRVVSGPNGTPNGPVQSLQRLRSKSLVPANADHDPFLVGMFLTMAQAHFYDVQHPLPSQPFPSRPSRSSRPKIPSRVTVRRFQEVKLHIITHDEDSDTSNPNFIIYSTVVTPAFLDRFHDPTKAPVFPEGEKDGDSGMKICYTTVPFWPILGLKERLAKALGTEIAGVADIEELNHIKMWDPLVEPQQPSTPASTLKRRRAEREPLAEVLNSSFEEDPPSSSDSQPVLSPDAKRRRTTRAATNTLEVY